MDDEIQYPSGFGLSDIVGWGSTGLVVLDKSSETIIKTPFDSRNEECMSRMLRERQAYERLTERGGHRGLLSYNGTVESGIRLEAGVIHGDLTCANMFLDKNLDAKLADFAGSTIDGSPILVLVTESHEFPGPLLSIHADLFAFGSVLYEIMSGHTPYNGLTETEIRARYLKGEFPDTTSLQACGSIIKKCWQGGYLRPETVIDDLRGIFFRTWRKEIIY